MGADAKVDMSKYKLVPEEKEEAKKGEFFIGKNHSTRDVVSEAIELLTKEEDGCRTLVLKARGQAVSKVVAIAEVIKRRVAGIHQIVKVDGGVVKHTYELKEDPTEDTRIVQEKFVTGLQVCLSVDELDKTAPGYQEPLPEDQISDVKDFTEADAPKKRRSAKKGGRGSGGKSGRGSGRGNGAPSRGAGGRGRSGKSGRGGQSSGRAR